MSACFGWDLHRPRGGSVARTSAAAKFKDADLVGIPIRIAVGKKGLAEGKVE